VETEPNTDGLSLVRLDHDAFEHLKLGRFAEDVQPAELKPGPLTPGRRAAGARSPGNLGRFLHLNLKATQQVAYCEGTWLVAYSW